MKLLSFGAAWCTSCLIMQPRLKELEDKISYIDIIHYDYDKNQEDVEKWDVKEILPTFILVNEQGKEIIRIMGEKSTDALVKLIEENKE